MKKAAHSTGAYRIRRLSRSGSGNSPNATSRVTARQTGGWSGNRRHAGPDETRDDSLHRRALACPRGRPGDSRSEEHTSELQSLMLNTYADFCLNKKNPNTTH